MRESVQVSAGDGTRQFRLVVLQQKPDAKCLCRAEAGIAGGATTEADDDVAASEVGRVGDQLPDAERGGAKRIVAALQKGATTRPP